MTWLKEDVLLLVDLVRRRPCLYDKQCESFHNTKLKLQVVRELAAIISSTRPGTTVDDILGIWQSLCSKFASYYEAFKEKDKTNSKYYFMDKMKFMCNHLELPKINTSTNVSNEENKDTTNHEVTEIDESPPQNGGRYPCLKLSRVEVGCNNDSDVENDSANDEQPRPSISAISIHSDNSLSTKKRNSIIFSDSKNRKRRLSTISLYTNPTPHDVSNYSLGSPLVNVNDTILDRTELYPNECQPNANGNDSFVSRRTCSPNEDEDQLYMRYIACKLKKLEGSQKLHFKLQLEKLFYESMN